MMSDLLSIFDCPVCFGYVLPPILQCQMGHLVCSSCRSKLTCCPICRGPLANIRNLGIEKLAEKVNFPCIHEGCSKSFGYTEKIVHEKVCNYRPYLCPSPVTTCKWQGSLSSVMPHLIMHHKSITTLQGEDIVFLATDIFLPQTVKWVMIQNCFKRNFLLLLEKKHKLNDSQQFYVMVQLIGPQEDAENFVYRVELNTNRRRLMWEALPNSIQEDKSNPL